MSNLSTAIRYDHTAKENPNLVDWSAKHRTSDNAEFLADVARGLAALAPKKVAAGLSVAGGGIGAIVLVGEYGFPGYVIRTAQGVLRVDRTPSSWSHALLLHEPLSTDPAVNRDRDKSAMLLQATLAPGSGMSHFAFKNGVSASRIGEYARAEFDVFAEHSVPNIAVLYFALTREERSSITERALNPDVDQLGYDLTSQLGKWFSYVTSRGAEPNPLSQGIGLASSSYAQLAYDAAGISLAPGAQQRNTTPEHIWQAVRFLHGTFRVLDHKTQNVQARRVGGWYCIRDRACVMAPTDVTLPRTLAELIASARSDDFSGRDPGASSRKPPLPPRVPRGGRTRKR